MGLVRGLILGAAVGSALAAILRKARPAEAPALPVVEGSTEPARPSPIQGAPADLKQALERVKRRAQDALDAAREAKREKEAQLERQLQEAKRQA